MAAARKPLHVAVDKGVVMAAIAMSGIKSDRESAPIRGNPTCG